MPLAKSRGGGGHSLSQKANSDASNISGGNITNWQNKLNNLQKPSAQSTTSGQAVVVETRDDAPFDTWYRKWSDGWIEQMGSFTLVSANQNFTLPIPFSNAKYSIVVTKDSNTNMSGVWAPTAHPLNLVARTTTQFRTATGGDYGAPKLVHFYACGY